MSHRVDSGDSSLGPQSSLITDVNHDSSVLAYAAGVGLNGGVCELGADSTIVLAGLPAAPLRAPASRPGSESCGESAVSKQRDARSENRPATPAGVHAPDSQPAQSSGAQSPLREEHIPPGGFRPVWEVDQLVWPESCQALFSSEVEYFRYAGEKLREASGQGLRILAIASTRLGEGCTTLAMCLARAVAAGGGRVALLDCNLQHAALSTTLGLEFSRGWQDAVNGSLPLGEVAVSSLSDGITLFPLSSTRETIDPAQFSELLRQVAAAVDLVILDVGPFETGHGCPIESGADCPVNAAMVVRDLRTTSEREVLTTAASLRDLGIDAIGIAENYAAAAALAAA